MVKINNHELAGEIERERLLDELESERTIWMGAVTIEASQEAYKHLDDLLVTYQDHLKVYGAQDQVEIYGQS